MSTKDQYRRQTQAIEQWGLDLVSSAFDSFAARIRDQARSAGDPAVLATLLTVAGAAEVTAQGAREEAQRRKSPPPIEITIRDRDGKTTDG